LASGVFPRCSFGGRYCGDLLVDLSAFAAVPLMRVK
jgi:hypothetical protein